MFKQQNQATNRRGTFLGASFFPLVFFVILLIATLIATVVATISIVKSSNVTTQPNFSRSDSLDIDSTNIEAFQENFVEPFPALAGDTGSEFIIVANKVDRVLHLLKRHEERWGVIKSFPISIGAVTGQKKVAGDKKTPEGLYFIVRRKESRELNTIFGPVAYVLNYPNRRDSSEQRSGNGIWIHGTEPGKVPIDTRGCLELHNNNLLKLESYLNKGAFVPVIIHSNPNFQFRKDIDLVAIRDERKRIQPQGMSSFSQKNAEGDTSSTFQIGDSSTGDIVEHLSQAPHDSKPTRLSNNKGQTPAQTGASEKELIQKQIEKWRSAWESENIVLYQSCFDTIHFKGEGLNWNSWRAKKVKTFQNYATIRINLTEIKISTINDSTAMALFRQNYRSDLFTSNNGKKLLFKKSKMKWQIIEEATVAL